MATFKLKESPAESSIHAFHQTVNGRNPTAFRGSLDSFGTAAVRYSPVDETMNALLQFVWKGEKRSSGESPPPLSSNSPSTERSLSKLNGSPKMSPPQFGIQIGGDMDGRFWEFYIQTWCPGRTTLKETNVWLTDFPQLIKSQGVKAAMLSLAGIYIYDSTPQLDIAKRTKELFTIAESRLENLLDGHATLEDDGAELIAIACLLSMQDIVLVENRQMKPCPPRWLSIALLCEDIIRDTNSGQRFWHLNSGQRQSSLRVSQTILVGQAVILNQVMEPLLDLSTSDLKKETSRFEWLLEGTENDVFEIHGACGFSRKLLHIFSQITLLSARLEGSIFTPMTMDLLEEQLKTLRQWSREMDPGFSYRDRDIMDWVGKKPKGYKINNPTEMTLVAAEAWRLAALVYLYCRGFRLPRNNPTVISTLSDLHDCVSMMPIDGQLFTMQIPLFPMSLLQLLTTKDHERSTVQRWFHGVSHTPIRSSIPPLYQTFQELSLQMHEFGVEHTDELLPDVLDRDAWWEKLVGFLSKTKMQGLCCIFG